MIGSSSFSGRISNNVIKCSNLGTPSHYESFQAMVQFNGVQEHYSRNMRLWNQRISEFISFLPKRNEKFLSGKRHKIFWEQKRHKFYLYPRVLFWRSIEILSFFFSKNDQDPFFAVKLFEEMSKSRFLHLTFGNVGDFFQLGDVSTWKGSECDWDALETVKWIPVDVIHVISFILECSNT